MSNKKGFDRKKEKRKKKKKTELRAYSLMISPRDSAAIPRQWRILVYIGTFLYFTNIDHLF